ncbi:Kelch repeat protein [Fonsecaea pedrosoi]|nr:Kelch repeat protein [Fonsecaea pedrosoi]
MVRAKWTCILDEQKVKRSSHALAVIGSNAYIYGGEIKPREPVDSDVDVVSLGEVQNNEHLVSKITASSSGPSPRVGVLSTVVNGQFYIFSGRGGIAMSPIEENGSLWAFDPLGKQWSRVAPKDGSLPYPEGRSYYALTSDGHNTLFLHAGCPEKGRLRDLWSFQIADQTWKRLADAPEPERGGPSIAYADGKLYRMNGFDGKTEQGGSLDIYHIADDTWTTVPYHADGRSGPTARSVSCLVPITISDKSVLVTLFGESDPSNLGHQGAGKMLDDIWIFHLDTSAWTKVDIQGENRPAPRGWFDADALRSSPSPKVVIHGGLAESNERLGDLWTLEFDDE